MDFIRLHFALSGSDEVRITMGWGAAKTSNIAAHAA
jgi:hypothetical protein